MGNGKKILPTIFKKKFWEPPGKRFRRFHIWVGQNKFLDMAVAKSLQSTRMVTDDDDDDDADDV